MRITSFLPVFSLIAVSVLPLAAKQSRAADLLSSLTGYAPVAFTYTCGKATGTTTSPAALPACTTSFTLPPGKLLVVQSISGSATPLNNANTAVNPVTFTTGQAYMSVTTSLGGTATPNLVGPNYALTGSNTWYFTILLTLYSDDVPVVANNNGPVYLQGYVYNK